MLLVELVLLIFLVLCDIIIVCFSQLIPFKSRALIKFKVFPRVKPIPETWKEYPLGSPIVASRLVAVTSILWRPLFVGPPLLLSPFAVI